MATTMLKVIGGNGQRHCVHVGKLMKQVGVVAQSSKSNSGGQLHADAPVSM